MNKTLFNVVLSNFIVKFEFTCFLSFFLTTFFYKTWFSNFFLPLFYCCSGLNILKIFSNFHLIGLLTQFLFIYSNLFCISFTFLLCTWNHSNFISSGSKKRWGASDEFFFVHFLCFSHWISFFIVFNLHKKHTTMNF